MKRLGCIFCVPVLLLLTLASVAAAGAPTFSIHRNAALEGSVWPGDFNGDGITDLAGVVDDSSTNYTPTPVVMLGNGDGTYGAAIRAMAVGRVFGTGDFNNDGKLDLFGFNTAGAPNESVFVLAGNGDGTFTRSGQTVQIDYARFGFSGDFDGDGNRDLAIAVLDENGNESIDLFRGHGDLTFDAPQVLPTPPELTSGIAVDLNGDGRRDIAVTNYYERDVIVFRNDGNMTFTPITVPAPFGATGVTAFDVTGDGKRDLVVSSTSGDGYPYYDGFASVLTGNGDGTFGAATSYRVARGAWKVVVADVTHDGVLDIVTANRSSIHLDDCGPSLKTWDSVSVLSGVGGGTFAAPHHFSIGNQQDVGGERDRNRVSSLNTSDLDGDGDTDLIVSNGTLFLTQPSDPNWAPAVSAGPDMTFNYTSEIILRASASDVDQDMLTYSWTTTAPNLSILGVPNPCISVPSYGTYDFTVTVDDGHGHQASDTVTYTFVDPAASYPTLTIQAPTSNEVITTGQPYTLKWHIYNPTGSIFETTVNFSADGGHTYSYAGACHHLTVQPTPADQDFTCTWDNPGPATTNGRFFITATDGDDAYVTGASVAPITLQDAPGAPPLPWAHQDVGAVGAAGSASYGNGVFTVTGSGADIWGTADEFHFVFRPNPGEIGDVELITRVDSVQNVNAWTKAGLMVRTSMDPGAMHASLFVSPGKGIAFQRRVTNGGTSVHTAGPAWTAPVWLRLTVRGGCNATCGPATIVRAYYRKNATDPWTFLGEQQYEGPQSQFAYVGLAVSSHVDGTTATAQFSNVSAREKPRYGSAAIGTTDTTANLTADDSWTLSASGADIWGTSDQFLYTYTQTPSTAVTARVSSLTNTNAWSKAGVMYRASTSTDSAHVMVVVTPGKGVAMQYRSTTGGISAQVAQVLGVTAPAWVRLTRSGTTYTGSYSTDGVTWTTLGSVTIAGLSGQNAGVALTSHATARATAVFENVYLEP